MSKKIVVRARDGITVPSPFGEIGQKAVPVDDTPFIRNRLTEGDLVEVVEEPAVEPQPSPPVTDSALPANADGKPGNKKK